MGTGQAKRTSCPLFNESEGAIHEEAQPRQGMTGLFSPESRAACSIRLLSTPDLQRQVSRRPENSDQCSPKGLSSVHPCWASQELMGVDCITGAIRDQPLSTRSLAPPMGLTLRPGCGL